MVSFHLLILAFLPLFTSVTTAHKEPHTPQEIEVQRALQAAAYHCAPAVAEFTASRKRSWTQKVLAGRPSLPTSGYQDLFSSETHENTRTIDAAEPDDHQKLLSCEPVEDSHIQNNTCVLAPEVTEGPYYHISGHPIRQNIAELQDGLVLLLNIGVIDVETCQPLPNVLVDIWQANATGFYAGHPGPSPKQKPQVGGMPLTPFPRTMPKETFLRGAWPTDRNGVAQFTTIFPGYYAGRATHIHTKVFPEWEMLPNGTFTSNHLAHAGQFFFDDDINLHIDNMHPYIMNPIRETRGRTRNWRDARNFFEDSHGPEGKYNPVFKLDLLGGVISQGLIGYITMGVNVSASYDNFWNLGSSFHPN